MFNSTLIPPHPHLSMTPVTSHISNPNKINDATLHIATMSLLKCLISALVPFTLIMFIFCKVMNDQSVNIRCPICEDGYGQGSFLFLLSFGGFGSSLSYARALGTFRTYSLRYKRVWRFLFLASHIWCRQRYPLAYFRSFSYCLFSSGVMIMTSFTPFCDPRPFVTVGSGSFARDPCQIFSSYPSPPFSFWIGIRNWIYCVSLYAQFYN